MKNIEKNCLQGLKRQKKLLANMICLKQLVCISKKKCLQRNINLKKSLQRKIFHTPPPLQENNGPSHLYTFSCGRVMDVFWNGTFILIEWYSILWTKQLDLPVTAVIINLSHIKLIILFSEGTVMNPAF